MFRMQNSKPSYCLYTIKYGSTIFGLDHHYAYLITKIRSLARSLRKHHTFLLRSCIACFNGSVLKAVVI